VNSYQNQKREEAGNISSWGGVQISAVPSIVIQPYFEKISLFKAFRLVGRWLQTKGLLVLVLVVSQFFWSLMVALLDGGG